ncbi:hypothetical protein DPMN_144435 [Dreissena polymorpha]|uniref:F-box domain-containing protein n=2 Tax=Dreissena polymorpha TaxID=45954 RepID=A0A9D4JMJ8_DREPO|nr:hypothetical protein DPMN_144435 [Dreissena polymorpha]
MTPKHRMFAKVTSTSIIRNVRLVKDNMASLEEWSDIADTALIGIFSRLSDLDRLNAACTCKNWYRLFSTSALWRWRRVKFDTASPELTAEREIKFLDKFGHCLNKLSISLGRPNFKTCMTISKAAGVYFQRMHSRNDIRLRILELEGLHMEQRWHFALSRNRLVSSLCKMIRKQKYIESIYMASARMRLVDGSRILEALAKGATGSTIKNIYMEDFFEHNVFPFRYERFVTAMSKFSSLESLNINYRYINGVMLRNMANKLNHCLKNLSLVIEGDVRGIEIPADVWTEFGERCPGAEVGIYLCTTVVRGNDLRTTFVRGIPIGHVYLTSWSRVDETESRLAALLRHLGNLYHNSMNSFAMFFEQHERIDAGLLFLLRRCRHLEDLCVQARLSADTVIEIMKLHHQNRLALKSINLTVPGLTSDDWRRIDAEKERLLTAVPDFIYVGPTEFGSSTSGSSTDSTDDVNEDVDDGGDDVIIDDDDEVFLINANNLDVEVELERDDDADNEEEGLGFILPPRDMNNNDDDNNALE